MDVDFSLNLATIQAETSLYSELEKLSAAWETLDKQAKSKVFDLTGLEERLVKLGIEVCRRIDYVHVQIPFLSILIPESEI